MTQARRWGAVVLLLAALAVWFGMAPESADPAATRDEIETTDEANNVRAEGAPQQAVVNGWTELDYSALISEQLETSAAEAARSTAMLGLGVAGICLLAATGARAAPTNTRPDTHLPPHRPGVAPTEPGPDPLRPAAPS